VPGWCSWYGNLVWAEYSGDRIPMGVRFFLPVQTGPDSHPASSATGIGSFIVEVVSGLEAVPFPLLFA
jgi:hypothetical protein